MRYLILLLIGISLTVSSAKAQNLFQVNATSVNPGGGGTTVSSGGSSLLGLVSNLTNNTQQFAPLQNNAFNANLNYAGINSALKFQQSFDTSGNRLISFQIPSIGVTKTFSSANGDLDTQIKNYLKGSGLADLTAFGAVVNKNSFAGIMDGNPLAATALLQDAGYQQFALHPSPIDLNGTTFTTGGGHLVNRVTVDGGVLDAGGTTGNYVDLTLSTEFRFNDYIGLSLVSPFRYENLHGADIFMSGTILGVPISILPAKGGPLSWTVTPAGHIIAAGSQDFVSGGLVYGFQLNSSLSATAGGFTLTLADNAGYYRGANLDLFNYSFDTHVDQWMFKNGLQLTKAWGDFFVDASASYTDFAKAAYVRGYFSSELGVGFKFGGNNNCGLRVGYTGNFGNGYNTNGGSVLLYFTQ